MKVTGTTEGPTTRREARGSGDPAAQAEPGTPTREASPLGAIPCFSTPPSPQAHTDVYTPYSPSSPRLTRQLNRTHRRARRWATANPPPRPPAASPPQPQGQQQPRPCPRRTGDPLPPPLRRSFNVQLISPRRRVCLNRH